MRLEISAVSPEFLLSGGVGAHQLRPKFLSRPAILLGLWWQID